MTGRRDAENLPRWLWLWLPLATTALPFVARLFSSASDRIVYGEFGLIENLTVLYLLIGAIAGVRLLLRSSPHDRMFRGWLIVLVLGAVYFAGEEISWGQHFFGWQTPETWAELNRQAETNLHNINSLFNQLPRTLLTAAAIIGGIVAPIVEYLRRLDYRPGSVASWLWPTYVCIPSAALAILVSWHAKAYALFDVELPAGLDIGAGETKEAMLAMFIMVYLLSLARRSRESATRATAP